MDAMSVWDDEHLPQNVQDWTADQAILDGLTPDIRDQALDQETPVATDQEIRPPNQETDR